MIDFLSPLTYTPIVITMLMVDLILLFYLILRENKRKED